MLTKIKTPEYLIKLNVSKGNWVQSGVSKRLVNPMTSTKSYWSTLKMFFNNKKNPCIPPLKQQNKYVADFKEKAEIFNSFFAEQCSLMNNSSKLPLIFLKRTDKFISSVSFSSNNFVRIIWDFDPNKAYDHDMISICIVKVCLESILKPLEIIFKSCIEKGQFPDEWGETTDLFDYFQYVEKYLSA